MGDYSKYEKALGAPTTSHEEAIAATASWVQEDLGYARN